MSYNYTTDVEFDFLYKILIIGDSGVGKTALLQRFSQDYFSTDYVATIGVDFQIRTMDVDAKRCKLQVWDTAGQDRFKCVVSSFYRGAHGVMICFDITDPESFRNVGNWLEEVVRYCPDNTPVYLVGTKADLQSKRMIKYDSIKTFADERKLSYIETSSKTRENIENCFMNFTRTLVQHTKDKELHYKKNNNNNPLTIGTRPVSNTNVGCMGSKCII